VLNHYKNLYIATNIFIMVMRIIRLEVDDIHCDKCVAKIKGRISSLDGIYKVDVIEYRKIVVMADENIDREVLRDVLEDLGYRVRG